MSWTRDFKSARDEGCRDLQFIKSTRAVKRTFVNVQSDTDFSDTVTQFIAIKTWSWRLFIWWKNKNNSDFIKTFLRTHTSFVRTFQLSPLTIIFISQTWTRTRSFTVRCSPSVHCTPLWNLYMKPCCCSTSPVAMLSTRRPTFVSHLVHLKLHQLPLESHVDIYGLWWLELEPGYSSYFTDGQILNI